MNRKALILVEARGAFFRPEGCGDYQPGLYNCIQAYKLARDLSERGVDPHLRFIVDSGLSPEEYSPTGKFLADRKGDRRAIVQDMRERHGIVYGVHDFLDPNETNSATYRIVSEVRDGSGFDLSDEETALARESIGRPYSNFEVRWWQKFIVNADFLERFLEFEREAAERLVNQTTFATYPNCNKTNRILGSDRAMDRDYINAVVDLLYGHFADQRSRFISGVSLSSEKKGREPNGFETRMDRFLTAIGIDENKLDKVRGQISLQVPINGHLTSYFDVRVRDGSVKMKPRDRLGLRGEEQQIGFEQFLKILTSGTPYVTSYPFTLARQMVDSQLIEYQPANGEAPKLIVDPTVESVYLVAERADPEKPEWDSMHMAVVDQLKRMFNQSQVKILSYPTDRLINPDVEGRRKNPRELGRQIMEKISDMEIPGVVIPTD